ncbi:MAG: LPXTG cell wall anchor domain-containing protein [Oscillospiraceae bacterium]
MTEGSTIVTLKKSCLDQLGVGTHRLGIVSSGGTAETTFTVKAKTILNNQTPTYNSSKPWTTPKTGDSANMGLWIGMIAVCAVGLGGVALYVVKLKRTSGTKSAKNSIKYFTGLQSCSPVFYGQCRVETPEKNLTEG